jgi:CrcB protein
MSAVLFVLGAGVGAAARHQVNQFGWGWVGTLVVNIVGSFMLGLLVGGAPSEATVTVVGTGMLGALTTFSMFALEATEGPPKRRIAVLTTTLVAAMLAVTFGYELAN